jgi:uncharacterized Tic20 family protein
MTQPKTTVTRYRKDTAHTFHIIMSFVTMGGWFLLIYGPLLIWRSIFKRKEVTTTYE